MRGGQRRGNPYPALSVSSAASSPTGGAKTRPENPTAPCLPPWGRCPPRGRRGPASPVPSLRGGAKPRRGNPSPRPQSLPPGEGNRAAISRPPSQSRLTPCQLPHRGSQDQAREPQRPLPPPLGEVPPQGAERARIPRPVIARSAATWQSVPRPPSQSAPLPAPPQGEPRPGPRTPTPPLPPPSGEVPPQGAERARIPRPPVIARSAATWQSVPVSCQILHNML